MTARNTPTDARAIISIEGSVSAQYVSLLICFSVGLPPELALFAALRLLALLPDSTRRSSLSLRPSH